MSRVGVLLWPGLLLLAGAVVALPFTLNATVAWERLLGLVAALLVGLAATWTLRLLSDRAVTAALLGLATACTLGGLWIVAADPMVFRGTVGALLDRLFSPISGAIVLTTPIALINTRFIVGYNGLADLCLVAIFCGGAVAMFDRRTVPRALGIAFVLYSLVLLVGTGSRGGLAGLVAGLWLAGVLFWRRGWLLALASLPIALALVVYVLPKGLDVSSTAGRFAFWLDLARLLVEYPFTGVGLGIDTAERVVLHYQVNPDPERIAYAHNTFVQTYLEQGPLGTLAMLFWPLLALPAAALALRRPLSSGQLALLMAGLSMLAGLHVHGLTDQVLTTNVGTLLLVLALAFVLASLPADVAARAGRWAGRATLAVVAAAVVVGLLTAVVPGLRAQAYLNAASLSLDQALLGPEPATPDNLQAAEALAHTGLQSAPGHPGLLRQVARAQVARFDFAAALDTIEQAASSPRLDAFDLLQIARLSRDIGQTQQAYTWAMHAYQLMDRVPPTAVVLEYRRALLPDDPRVRVLADQGEAAIRAERYAEAVDRFQQALSLAPDPPNAYLRDRADLAQRLLERQQSRQWP